MRKCNTLYKIVNCNTIHIEFSKLHKSLPKHASIITDSCSEGTENILSMASGSDPLRKGINIVKSMVVIVQPILEKQLNVNFHRKHSSSTMTSPPVTPQEIRKKTG